MADTNKKPTHEVRVGGIRATIWENGASTEGRGTFHNVTVSRRYKHDGEWKQSSSFGFDDLPVLEKAIGLAWDWVRAERDKARAASGQVPSADGEGE